MKKPRIDYLCSLPVVAAELGVSPARAQQIEAQALRKLRRMMEQQRLSWADLSTECNGPSVPVRGAQP